MGSFAKQSLLDVCVCLFQPPVSFAELMADGGSSVWPMWELIKWIFGKSDYTLPSIGITSQDNTTLTHQQCAENV